MAREGREVCITVIGEYRIGYEIDDRASAVTVFRVAPRRESYR